MICLVIFWETLETFFMSITAQANYSKSILFSFYIKECKCFILYIICHYLTRLLIFIFIFLFYGGVEMEKVFEIDLYYRIFIFHL